MAKPAIPRSTTRRSFLAATCVGLSLGAGRSGDQRPPVGLGKIQVVNRLETAITAHVTVERASEEVYDRSHELDARTGTVVDQVRIVEGWMGDRVDYEVTVAVSPGDREATYSTADAQRFVSDWGANECYSLLFTVDGEDIGTALGGMESCPRQTTNTASATDS